MERHRLAFLIAGTAFAAMFAASSGRADAAIAVWVAPESTRVGPTVPAPRDPRLHATLAAARNETVSFQIVVTAGAGGLGGVRIAAAPFVQAHGAPATLQVALYREHFVDVPHASAVYGHPRSLGAGTYPDGLIPFVDDFTGKPPVPSRLRAEPFTIPAGQSQPYWVDVAVPPATAPGDYHGTFTVTSAQGSAMLEASLHVWRTTMPPSSSVESDFEFDHPANATLASQEELLRNRLQPNPDSPSHEGLLQRGFGLRLADLGFWGGAYYGHCKLSQPPTVKTIAQAVATHTVPIKYDQAADEIGACKNFRSTLVPIEQHWARNLHAAGALNLLTMQPVRALEDDGSGHGRSAVDIWAMLPDEYDRAANEVRRVVTQGYRAWWYTALSQDRYSPKWEIDVSPGNYRIEALIDASLRLSGQLYWAVDFWHPNAWDDVEYRAGSEYFAGEGILLYPGSDVGTVGAAPSMRLKWIRDGTYDADEVALLQACGLGAWAFAQTRTIAADFHHWTDDPAAIARVHRALALRLDESCPN